MSSDSEIGHNIEVLKQTMRDAKRLKKELASQIRALDDKFKRIKEGTRRSKKTRTKKPVTTQLVKIAHHIF